MLMFMAGCERAKTKLDREVDRLCAKDGGVHVFERVYLAPENFGSDGEVFPQFKGLLGDLGRYGAEYSSDIWVDDLVSGNPSLHRIRAVLIRRADKKVLGELINYKRVGGDGAGPWETSTYSCVESIGFESLANSVFLRIDQ